MGRYRFIGTETILPVDTTITEYGQPVERDSAETDALIAAHPPAQLLPEELWEECGITEEERAKHPAASNHDKAPPEFQAKARAARDSYHKYREGLIAAAKTAAESVHQTGA